MNGPRKLIRTYQDLKEELRRLEARDCLERLASLRAARDSAERLEHEDALRRVWMLRS